MIQVLSYNFYFDNSIILLESLFFYLFCFTSIVTLQIKNKQCTCCAGDTISGITSSGKFTPCLWISNYTDKYDVTSFTEMKEEFKAFKKLSDSCTATNITGSNNLNNAITIKLR